MCTSHAGLARPLGVEDLEEKNLTRYVVTRYIYAVEMITSGLFFLVDAHVGCML